MTRFVDYAWWQVSPAQLTAMGFSGAMRYLSHDNSKDLSAPERDNLRAAGFDIGLVCESVANRAAQGFAAGAADGQFYNSRATALGYPADATLWYAVDFDASAAQVQPYFDGVASVGGRLEAPYGGYKVVDGVRYRAPYGWQTVAWSGGRVSPRAGLLQNGFQSSYDTNQILVPAFGQWLSHPLPVPQEEDMAEPGPAVDAVMNADGTGWVLDRWGGISSVGGAPSVPNNDGHYWPGQDVARRLVVTDPAKPAGYVLDCKGGLHEFGGAPKPQQPAPYWP